MPELTAAHKAWIAEQIFANECNLKTRCLTSWNEGEDFPSLGIGHFIWFRAGQQEPYLESFPALIRFYQARGHAIPDWLRQLPALDSPWQTRSEFLADLDNERLRTLRSFLLETQSIQADFILARLHDTLPQLQAASHRPEAIETLFYQLAQSHPPHGMYALIDYVNFKGEGTSDQERYQGQGWGLLQVLEYMLDHPGNNSLLQHFSDSARAILARRIANAPPERRESRWTAGWNRRVAGYQP
ncbi:MAG: hypothetical protein RQ757_10240 [Pseudomonadales bacterium]|nr:hypothetical protein [Pseudomonadales bacterium]